MTGGTGEARALNRALATAAQKLGLGMGVGSQRAMLADPACSDSFQVRDVAPDVLLLANLGAVQAREAGVARVAALVDAIGADALCIHLNPAMELVQTEGDRDFRGGLATLERLNAELGVPLVVKETGCGISPGVAERLRGVGVRHVDVSGAGGTSWVAVETERAETASAKSLGETFREWGIPTAASVALIARHGFDTLFATGGIRSGLDIAKAIALGATAGGIARSSLKTLESGGREAALAFFDATEAELRTAMLLVGAKDLAALRAVPRVLVGELKEWLEQM
jgi:isopentenyl-diphosphate delta-isomerase